MTRNLILFLFTFTIWTHSFGQKIGDYYVTVDSLRSLQFRLLTDSTIEFSTIWRHMSPSRKAVYNYYITDTTIEILPIQLTERDTLQNGIVIDFLNIKENMSLLKIDGGFIDNNQSLIYIRQKDFGKNPALAYIVDGKTFFQDNGVTDGYGLLKRKPKLNRPLQRKLKGLSKDNCNIEIVKGGLNSYRRFGIKYVYGAIVITTSK
jgi:hypothetical protein